MTGDATSDDALAARVAAIVARTARIDPARVTGDSNFAELGLNSIDALNIVFMLEDELNITIPGEAVPGVASIRQIVESLRPLVAQGRSIGQGA